ncbi:MAG TPA: 1,2-phenylacetyl-CoA epoxidase subunit PaaC [Puia sp.]|jgi:ring-1,2-phenylacetyl-CoA epoxidase subunit PaaC
MSHSTRIDYTLHLADNALILGHRNSEWTGHGPILEQDIALSNIALDLIGQARNFYQYAARLLNETGGSAGTSGEVTEDALAYLRDAWDFKNCLLAEQAGGDWARTILRQFFISAYQFFLYEELQQSRDSELAAISEKSLKEVSYHLRWSSEWVIRLGDGTAESHTRMKKALDDCWKFTGELFLPAGYEKQLAKEGIAPDLTLLQEKWDARVREVFEEAQLSVPDTEGKRAASPAEKGSVSVVEKTGSAAGKSTWMQTGGKEGRHTEQLGYVLAEMQFLQRAYPGCEW